jgi:hypothetical protein
MFSTRKMIPVILVALGMVVIGATFRPGTVAAGQATNTPAAATAIDPQKAIAGEIEAKKMLLLMDADKDGKVSKEEFMKFMEAEFDRMDKNHDGYLDVKELERSQLETVRHGGGHR